MSKLGFHWEGRIICDPPTFGRSEKGTFQIEKDLPHLIRSCFQCLNPNGRILFATNFEKWNLEGFHYEIQKALSKQEYNEDFEVIIVEDGSSLRCESIVDKYRPDLSIFYYYKKTLVLFKIKIVEILIINCTYILNLLAYIIFYKLFHFFNVFIFTI